MAKIIHTADLHIKADEKIYCYAVLDEIIELARAERADFLVIAGDLFDSHADFETLRKEVVQKLTALVKAGCRVIYIPGNHEARGSKADLAAFNLEPLEYCARGPFNIVEGAGVEFLCVPHADNYDGYRDWKIPPKKDGVTRVAVIHALNSTIFTGPDPEADTRAGAIEDDFFARFKVDYAAMGHIHLGRQHFLGGAIAAYPGSPRVWRAHPKEAGVKSVRLVETGGSPVNSRTVEIQAGGQYREYVLPVQPDGGASPLETQRLEAEIGGRDLVSVTLAGIVEDENAAAAAAKALKERLEKRCRRAEVELDTRPAPGLYSSDLTRNFLKEMDAVMPDSKEGPDYRRWLLARKYGLEEIAERLGGAK